MLRGGVQTGAGLTLRVYEVRADGSRHDVLSAVHTYGSRPAPASIWEPRRNAEACADPVGPPPRGQAPFTALGRQHGQAPAGG